MTAQECYKNQTRWPWERHSVKCYTICKKWEDSILSCIFGPLFPNFQKQFGLELIGDHLVHPAVKFYIYNTQLGKTLLIQSPCLKQFTVLSGQIILLLWFNSCMWLNTFRKKSSLPLWWHLNGKTFILYWMVICLPIASPWMWWYA